MSKLKTAGIISLIIYIVYTLGALALLLMGGAFAGVFGALGGSILIIGVLMLALCIMGIIGSSKIMKNKGRVLYLIPTFIFVLLGVLGIFGALFGGNIQIGSLLMQVLFTGGLAYSLILVLKHK